MADKAKPEGREKEVDVNVDKSKPVIVMLIVLAVLVLVFTPIVTILALKAFVPTDTDTNQAKMSKIAEVQLDSFKFNVAQSQGTRFAQITVVIEVSDSEMAKLFKPSSKENPEGMESRFRSEILDILSERSLEGLLSKDSRNSLRKEIQSKLNALLGDRKVKGVVTDVYFPSFLIQ